MTHIFNKLTTILRATSWGRFALPLGTIMIVIGCLMYKSIQNHENFFKIQAIVTSAELTEPAHYDGDTHVDDTYLLTVAYTVDGIEYNQEYGEYTGYKVGDSINILYNPADPTEIAQPIAIGWPIGIFILGVTAIVSGLVDLVNAYRQVKKLSEQERKWHNDT